MPDGQREWKAYVETELLAEKMIGLLSGKFEKIDRPFDDEFKEKYSYVPGGNDDWEIFSSEDGEIEWKAFVETEIMAIMLSGALNGVFVEKA